MSAIYTNTVIPALAGIQRRASARHVKRVLKARLARAYLLDSGSALAKGSLVRNDVKGVA